MRDLLASPRRRRRLLTGAIGLIVVGGVTFSMIHWSNTSHFHMAPIRYNEKAQVAEVPVKTDFRRAKKEGVLHVAAQFVNTAVRRKHVERSYDLATPTLKTGYTRRTWATQDIPVVPYPLDFAKYQLKGSFTDEVWIQVALFPDKAHKNVPSAVYDIVLKPFGHGNSRHWLVDSWAPAGYLNVPAGPLTGNGGRPLASTQRGEWKGKVGTGWLLLPISAFLLGLVLVTTLALRGWWRDSRAVKRYKSTYL